MNRQFETPEPIDLYVEIGKGKVEVSATAAGTTTLEIEGRAADEVAVTFENNRLTVIAPKDGGSWFSGRDSEVRVHVELPPNSNLAVKTGSADISVEGEVSDARLKTGSGDIPCDPFPGSARLDTGSGDVEVSEAHAELQVKSGSGDISVGTCVGRLNVS